MTGDRRLTLLAAILGSGIVFLDGTIVNVALRRIGQDLPASILGVLEGQTYIVSGYLATLAALLILSGALADHYGRRRMFILGLVGFGTMSLLCGLSPTLEVLVVARVLQGAAGALLVPGALSIITATFEGPERSRAFGRWAAATSALTVLGPTIGGFLVDTISWRMAFFINLPLVVIALYAAIRGVAESRNESASGSFDWLGSVIVAGAVGGLAFGGIRGQESTWQDPVAFVSLGVGAVLSVWLPIHLARTRHPLVPLTLFRVREFAVLNLSTLLVYGALYVIGGFQAIYFQGTLGYTALAAGMLSLPTGILLTTLSTRVGSIASRIGPRPFLIAGPSLMAVSVLWFARIPATSAAWRADLSRPASLVPPVDVLVDVLPYLILFGAGISMVVAPLTSSVMNSVDVRNAGLASAINNAISRVGQPLLGAVIFIAITATFYASLAGRLPGTDTSSADFRRHVAPLNVAGQQIQPTVAQASREASTDGFRVALVISAGLLAAGAAVNAVGMPREHR